MRGKQRRDRIRDVTLALLGESEVGVRVRVRHDVPPNLWVGECANATGVIEKAEGPHADWSRTAQDYYRKGRAFYVRFDNPLVLRNDSSWFAAHHLEHYHGK